MENNNSYQTQLEDQKVVYASKSRTGSCTPTSMWIKKYLVSCEKHQNIFQTQRLLMKVPVLIALLQQPLTSGKFLFEIKKLVVLFIIFCMYMVAMHDLSSSLIIIIKNDEFYV